ncbi:MAG: 4Fe-4S binding protein [Gammaproteobacteria bacterium]|nr:4Fe-4S binding protein [Gammaproteobacteria bacterium]
MNQAIILQVPAGGPEDSQASESRWRRALGQLGDAMARHKGVIVGLQWLVVLVYFSLVAIPAFLDLPDEDARILTNLTLFAQFLFWGIWWPFAMLSMMLMGRAWCGVLCPEGALSEWVSRHGLNRAIPRWLRWGGWPFVSFGLTTVIGQLTSIYQYPKPVFLILGGSTAAALVVGLLYGRGVRVWCRYLCPANGVFQLLARIAPVHFAVSEARWNAAPRLPAVNCPPLLDVKRQAGTGACHNCGRCSGHREAVRLTPRSPWSEILGLKLDKAARWEVLTLAYGVLGIAMGAFQWSASPWYVQLKSRIAEAAIAQGQLWLLADNAPWWLLTHYPEVNDVFTWLDGLAILLYIGAETLVLGTALLLGARLAGLAAGFGASWRRLAYAYTPLAGISVFLGLSMTTISLLAPEGVNLAWVSPTRAALLLLAALAGLHLSLRILSGTPWARRLPTLLALSLGAAPVFLAWAYQFWWW